MMYAPFRRHRRFRLRIILVTLFLAFNFLEVLYIRCNIASAENAKSRSFQSRQANSVNKTIFIATPLWNANAMLRGPWGDWNNALLTLVRDLGPENVFVSILEGGSYDTTKEALQELDEDLGELGVRRRIIMEDETHEDLIAQTPGNEGWVNTRNGTREFRRIPYLSKIRNRTLQPLQELWDAGERFDYVLFLGDVVFSSEDVFTLLDTNDGEYAAACALDFSKPPLYYDTFVLRDSFSNPTIQLTWPYFRDRTSRSAMKKHKPVPVASCWNGIVAMPAEPFVEVSTPLRFRALPDTLAEHHFEASECCLIHADNELFAKKPVFLNPAVRVGYNQDAYDSVHQVDLWLSSYDILHGLWKNRMKRWISMWFWSDRGRQMHLLRRLQEAEQMTGVEEKAGWCVVDEMQVLSKIGWKHV